MKEIRCKDCGTLVAELAEGSRIRYDAVCRCGACDKRKTAIPDFLQGLKTGKFK